MLTHMTPRAPLPIALLALALTGCHEDAIHADIAPGGLEPPRCDALRQLEPCPGSGLVARAYISPEPTGNAETLDIVWTYDDPYPIFGWRLIAELCTPAPGAITDPAKAPRALRWFAEAAFDRIDNALTDDPPRYAITRCRPGSSTAVERETFVDGNYRIERWRPTP